MVEKAIKKSPVQISKTFFIMASLGDDDIALGPHLEVTVTGFG